MNYNEFKLISWSNTFSCGVKLIDEQHKELINLVNDMFSHVTGNEKDEQEYFKKIIHKSIDYIKIHFSTEEKIMLSTNFYGYAKHKLAHEKFIYQVIKHTEDFKSMKQVTLYSFTKFLKDWILSHIAVMDKMYFVYLRKIASYKENGKLTINKDDVNTAYRKENEIPSKEEPLPKITIYSPMGV